jgi:hypothetical protein
MFIGHFAPALIAATDRDAPSLPVLFIGAQLVDWAFFGFVLAGVEHVRFVPGLTVMNPMDLYDMPWTHSLLGASIWALGFGVLLNLLGASRRGTVIGMAVVLSHWLLDWLVHAPDLTWAGQPPKLGLGLWNYPAIEMPLELGLILGSLAFWSIWTGRTGLRIWAFAAILVGLQAVDWLGAKPHEPGPSFTLLAWFAYSVATVAAWWASQRPVRAII